MHRNEIIYALICINNHVLSCLISMLSSCPTRRHARPSAIEIEEGCDNLDTRVSRDCALEIWADARESMIQESYKEASKVVLEPEVDA